MLAPSPHPNKRIEPSIYSGIINEKSEEGVNIVEPIKIEDNEVKKAIQSGHPYIQVDAKKYLLMEVEEVNEYASYIVTDPDEEERLKAALDHTNPILTEDEINAMLGTDS